MSTSATELLENGGPSPTLRALAGSGRRASGDRDVKKGGAGKGGWGVVGDELNAVSVLDESDPNFDPEQGPFMLDSYVPRVFGDAYKAKVIQILENYLQHGQVKECSTQLEALDEPLYTYFIVSKVIKLGLPDQHSLVLDLLSYVSSPAVELVSLENLEQGLFDCFESVEDWELDSPGLQNALIDLVGALEQSDRIAGGFLEREASYVKRRPALKYCLMEVMEEFFANYDIKEFVAHVANMDCTPFHAHVVKYIIRAAVSQSNVKKEHAAQLLCALRFKGPITTLQVMRGVEYILGETEDIVLDNPRGVEALSEILARAVVDECLPPSFLNNVFSIHKDDAGKKVIDMAKSVLEQPKAAEVVMQQWSESTAATPAQ